jgi:hypothetical protein
MQFRLTLNGFQPPRVAANGESGGKGGTSSHCQREHQTPAKRHSFAYHSKT